MTAEINNLKVAIKLLVKKQKVTNSASIWQSFEDELIDLREKLEKLEHGTT